MAQENNNSEDSKKAFEVEQSEPKQGVSHDYLIVMERRPQTLYPIASDKSVFITAVHPGMAEDDITAAMLGISWQSPGRGKRSKRGQPQGEQSEAITMYGKTGAARGFVEKCYRQITDFRLLVQEENGEEGIRKYEPKNDGNNRSNREVYESILMSTQPIKSLGDQSYWDVVEGFLDSVAGRETDTAEDFDELKKDLPQLVSDM